MFSTPLHHKPDVTRCDLSYIQTQSRAYLVTKSASAPSPSKYINFRGLQIIEFWFSILDIGTKLQLIYQEFDSLSLSLISKQRQCSSFMIMVIYFSI